MNRVTIRWDDRQTVVTTPAYYATIRTGMSVAARNVLTVLGMTHPNERKRLWDALMQLAGEIGNLEESGALEKPGVVRTLPFTWWVDADARAIHLEIVYGFVPNGARQRGQLHGWFKLVILCAEEHDDALLTVFEVNKLLAKAVSDGSPES